MNSYQKTEIKKIISRNLEVLFLEDNKPVYKEMEKRITKLPVNYRYSEIMYQMLYFQDRYDEFDDFTCIIYRGGNLVAIWPLCIYGGGETVRKL